MNDNRNYIYSEEKNYIRQEFPIICNWLEDGAKVIDLGCGDGSLIRYISERKKISIQGIELSLSGVEMCKKSDLKVEAGKIDDRLSYSDFQDEEFDYAICNVTIQMVMYPEVLLQEMRRIAKNLIISFPNFAYFENRIDLLFSGVMPKPMLHKYEWFNTGHIHQLSNKDFKTFCQDNGIEIIEQYHLGCFRYLANLCCPNFFSKESIFLCKKI